MSESSHPPQEPRTPGSHYQPALTTVLIIVALFIGATFLMLRYTSPSVASPSTTTTSPSSTSSTTLHSTTTSVTKAQVRVQVANGTLTSGLARSYTQQLLTLGWDALPEANGPRVTSTVVYYNPGFKWAAVQIANAIHVRATAVQSLNGQTPVSGAASDDVIVVLGPDAAIIQG
jgi:hypothetical protein